MHDSATAIVSARRRAVAAQQREDLLVDRAAVVGEQRVAWRSRTKAANRAYAAAAAGS